MVDDLKIIKKKYGENMSHLCRELFPTILEQNGVLSKLMLDNFNETHDLYDDIILHDLIIDFKTFIYNKFYSIREDDKEVTKTPKELLSMAGYNLVECTKEREIQNFKKYYAFGETLCTFSDLNRLKRCRVFFAVKKNVDEIKRENFKEPKREDEYGTSVISIQFTKDGTDTLSIKNRYNHTVNNPDATFKNNLDNIIEGLTDSFEKYYGIKQLYVNNDFEIDDYVIANDGKYYKYNYEINNVYYCPNNIIIDNFNVKQYEKEKYIILDYYILNLVNKKIMLYDRINEDSFVETITNIDKIEIKNIENGKAIKIKTKDNNDIEIELDKLNRIIKYTNNKITKLNNWFLWKNTTLIELNIPNVEFIGEHCCIKTKNLKILNAPLVEEICKESFIYNNIEEIDLKNLKRIGNLCFEQCKIISKFNAPKLKEIGYSCFENAKITCDIFLPNLMYVDAFCFADCVELKNIYLPKLKKMGHSCFENNKTIEKIKLPKLKEMGISCFRYNISVKEFHIPFSAISCFCFINNQYIQNLLNKNKKKKSLILKK